MAKATVKGKYDVEKNAGSAVATVAFYAGDVRLKASVTDATVVKGPSLNGLVLSVEKPGPSSSTDFRFQFMNTVRVLEKPLSLTYIHFHAPNRTTMDGTLTFDPANKYAYAHGSLRRTVFEPTYDFSKGAWDFAVSRKFEGDDTVRASYETSRKNLKLEWSRNTKVNGIFKIGASVDMAEEQKTPKLVAESTWNFDLL
ncbi:unnamed protein product [Spirodela intermedia]|uniref:Uncharacterized protein n=1 Tax=Spirodela intermedia TaxID=51605 RepID=A0A7I8I7L5_SPIIN|nr:unnamed protein product [Spirodela intermedia]CAA6653570.1 unnamed protein product [Spirodela intermedia]